MIGLLVSNKALNYQEARSMADCIQAAEIMPYAHAFPCALVMPPKLWPAEAMLR